MPTRTSPLAPIVDTSRVLPHQTQVAAPLARQHQNERQREEDQVNLSRRDSDVSRINDLNQ